MPLINFTPGEEEEIVQQCSEFLTSAKAAGRESKDRKAIARSYSKCKFAGGDLLPIPSTKGNERDNNKSRPQVFIPLTRQQLKIIYAMVKMSIIPNDQDYFRIRAKTEAGMPFEELLTNGCKYMWRDAGIPDKLSAMIYNACWAGFFSGYPTVDYPKAEEWEETPGQPIIDPETGEMMLDEMGMPLTGEPTYDSTEVDLEPKVDLEVFDPMSVWVDPSEPDPEKRKWGYCKRKKAQDILDSPLYFNKEKIIDLIRESENSGKQDDYITRSKDDNDIADAFSDKPGFVGYDLVFFPYLELKSTGRNFRHVLVGVVGEQVLVRFEPSRYPNALNPNVLCSWSSDLPDNPYGYGPAEELIPLQQLINMLWNYKLEVMARAGNRFAVRPNVDLSNFWGVASGIAVTDDPRNDIASISGDYTEIASLDNTIGVLKAEAQFLSGAQNPFQGSSQVDYQKTATEMQIVQENSMSIQREAIEHLAGGVRKVLERLMYLSGDLYGVKSIPFDTGLGKRVFKDVDFSLLSTGQFTIEMSAANPSQSKQAQVNSLMQLMEFLTGLQDPGQLVVLEPIIEKLGILQGLKDIGPMIDEIKKRMMSVIANAAPVPGTVPPGVGAIAQPPMAELPIAPVDGGIPEEAPPPK